MQLLEPRQKYERSGCGALTQSEEETVSGQQATSWGSGQPSQPAGSCTHHGRHANGARTGPTSVGCDTRDRLSRPLGTSRVLAGSRSGARSGPFGSGSVPACVRPPARRAAPHAAAPPAVRSASPQPPRAAAAVGESRGNARPRLPQSDG